jgi:tRNA(Ile)-lysidine synthase
MRRPPAVARVLERVTKTAREHEMFREGDTVLVSVSGGPDSVCLLYSLSYLRRLFKIRLEVFHFDHRLRKDSARDAEYVRRLAERMKLPFHLRAAEDAPAKGVSVEAWATVARNDAANDVRKSMGARVTAEGHTLDDQAETVLLNLIRGGGLEAVTGIWPGGSAHGFSGGLAQPMIDVERDEVEAFCRALHLRPRRDPTNADTRLLRNAIRLEVLPAIERATGREVKRSIARTGDLLRADRIELNGAAVHALSKVLESPMNGPRDVVRLEVAALRSLPKPIASRVVRLAVYNVMASDDVAPWTRDAVEAVLDLAQGRVGRRRDLPNGLKARREQEYVSVSRTSPESRE